MVREFVVHDYKAIQVRNNLLLKLSEISASGCSRSAEVRINNCPQNLLCTCISFEITVSFLDAEYNI